MGDKTNRRIEYFYPAVAPPFRLKRCYDHQPTILSFPQRRSSDLKPATVETGIKIDVPSFINIGDVIKIDTVEGKYLARSEEHTSELQSLRHLVCRLLLEK